jgi:hypothetical protein
MAISIISSIEKTASPGTIDIPETCDLVVAVVDGSVIPPTIGGIAMGVVGEVPATSIIPAISIHQYRATEAETIAYTFIGTTCEFVFIADGDSYRPGTIAGYDASGVYGDDLVSSASDLVIGILHGSIGPTTLETDEVEMTYLKDSTLVKIGYVLAAGALLACLASDTGASEGYWVDGGTLHHDSVLVSEGYWGYENTWIEGYYVVFSPPSPFSWVPDHWTAYGVFIPGHYETVYVWHEGHYEQVVVWHDPVYLPAWDEDLPDTWVPAGTSQISAIFCSISQTAGGEFISRPIAFQ